MFSETWLRNKCPISLFFCVYPLPVPQNRTVMVIFSLTGDTRSGILSPCQSKYHPAFPAYLPWIHHSEASGLPQPTAGPRNRSCSHSSHLRSYCALSLPFPQGSANSSRPPRPSSLHVKEDVQMALALKNHMPSTPGTNDWLSAAPHL